MTNPRVTSLWLASVAALQAVVREHRVTQAELQEAGQYFNRLGQSGMFPSLLAVGLAMTSVEVTARTGGTRPNLQGPYYKPGAPLRPDGCLLEREPPSDAPLLILSGMVSSIATVAPIAGAELDIWQADHRGHYDTEGYQLRGVVLTDALGRYAVRSVVPRDYSDHDHDPVGELFRAMGRHNRRAAHIHFKLRVDGVERLMTQLFIGERPYLDSDYVEGAVSEDLIIRLSPPAPGRAEYAARFDFVLP